MNERQALVLIPGLLCTERLWAHQLDHLADVATCQVADVTAVDTIDAMADAVLAAAPRRFALCGLSMGGIVAHAIMRRAAVRVTRLALLDTTARTETSEQTERRRALLALTDAGRFNEVPAAIMPALVHPDRIGETTLTDGIVAMAESVGPDAFRRQINAIITRPPALAALASYRCPTQIICGREDAITTLEMHEEMAVAIPGSRLAVIEQCGHITTMERPHAVTALLRQWLSYP